jgi:hypothetical protein
MSRASAPSPMAVIKSDTGKKAVSCGSLAAALGSRTECDAVAVYMYKCVCILCTYMIHFTYVCVMYTCYMYMYVYMDVYIHTHMHICMHIPALLALHAALPPSAPHLFLAGNTT